MIDKEESCKLTQIIGMLVKEKVKKRTQENTETWQDGYEYGEEDDE